jgi:hypothetical protein
LLENCKQHHSNHKPDGQFGKPGIVQMELQSRDAS